MKINALVGKSCDGVEVFCSPGDGDDAVAVPGVEEVALLVQDTSRKAIKRKKPIRLFTWKYYSLSSGKSTKNSWINKPKNCLKTSYRQSIWIEK
jgi:hypothetical protein